MVTLTATSRANTGKGVARKLRAAGQVPGAIYGPAREPLSLVLDNRELERLLGRIAAESTVIDLTVDGTSRKTLIREIQRHPLRAGVVHIDFLELVAGETVSVHVPVEFEGIPVGVRADGGIFEELLHEVEIEADPVNIPASLVVDVSELVIGHSLHVSDIKLPPGVELLTDESVTICICSAPRAEEAAKPAVEVEGVALAEPELIRKAKDDEEGEAADAE
jgi:large subunit ribosomal protein L25